MSIPLSQLMQSANPDVGPPTTTHDLCLSAKLFAELHAATERYTELEAKIDVETARVSDPERPVPPRRVGQKSDLRQLEAEAEEEAAAADAIRSRMAETSVTLHLKVDEDGWTAFTRQHPARDAAEDPAGAQMDRLYTGSLCNVDELITTGLPTFIAKYGDEPPGPGMWEYARANSARGDRYLAASKVVQLHTRGIDLGKSRTALRSSRRLESASE